MSAPATDAGPNRVDGTAPEGTALFRAKALEQLASPDRIDLAPRLIRPVGWLALAALALALLAGLAGAAVVTIPTELPANGILLPGEAGPEAVLFVRPALAQRLRPGMAVRLSVEAGVPARLEGRLAMVAARPARQEALASRTGDPALAQALAQAGAGVELRVALAPPPPAELLGLYLQGAITTGRRSVLSRILPLAGTAE